MPLRLGGGEYNWSNTPEYVAKLQFDYHHCCFDVGPSTGRLFPDNTHERVNGWDYTVSLKWSQAVGWFLWMHLLVDKLGSEVRGQSHRSAVCLYTGFYLLRIHSCVILANPGWSCGGWTSHYVNQLGSGSVLSLSHSVSLWWFRAIHRASLWALKGSLPVSVSGNWAFLIPSQSLCIGAKMGYC